MLADKIPFILGIFRKNICCKQPLKYELTKFLSQFIIFIGYYF